MKTSNPIRFRPQCSTRRAFTLVEVMVSLLLVVMVVMGVTNVFKMSTDAIGATQGLSSIMRDHRSALPTLESDFKNCVADSPIFVISNILGVRSAGAANQGPVNGPNCAYKNMQEHLANLNYDPTYTVINGMGVPIPIASLSDRVPRLDSMMFFTRGKFRRQTWPANTAISNVTSSEACVWYGFLNRVMPGNAGYLAPENTYAQDRMLGRVALLAKDSVTIPSGQPYWGMNSANPAQLTPLSTATPLQTNGASADMGNAFNTSILGARYDLLGASVDQIRVGIDTAYKYNPATWYSPLISGNPGKFNCIFFAQPQITRPVTAEKLAYTTPIFASHCTQFIVEYAGDFLAQDDTTGAIISDPQTNKPGIVEYIQNANAQNPTIVSGWTDGKIDFIIDPVTKARRIRWYGLPRDTNGDGRINFYKNGNATESADVVPFVDVIRGSSPGLSTACGTWEVVWPPSSGNPSTGLDYMKLLGSGSANTFRYICAFHNRAPLMLRILMKIDDPTGKLQDGQWYEYILSRQ